MRKIKLKKKFYTYGFVILLIAGFLICIFHRNNTNEYDPSAIMVLNEEQKNEINKHEYSKTLEEIALNNLFIEEYFDQYLKIEYKDKPNFLSNINSFLKKGYSAEEVNKIFFLSDLNIEKLLNNDYIDINPFIGITNFDVNNYNRYIEYQKNNAYDLKDIVTYVNVGADLTPYQNTTITENPDDYLVLVNKFHGLKQDYQPTDLVAVPGYYGNKVYMRSAAKEALELLQNDIKKEIGTTLLPTTAFRGYSLQATLYNNYVINDGTKKADTYSARPGFSEHQTGLAIDLKNPKLTNIRLNDDDYTWLKENAYKYGFIIRFPKNKEMLTGYNEENWHIRYVGIEVAKLIHEQDLCLEEYIDKYITQY